VAVSSVHTHVSFPLHDSCFNQQVSGRPSCFDFHVMSSPLGPSDIVDVSNIGVKQHKRERTTAINQSPAFCLWASIRVFIFHSPEHPLSHFPLPLHECYAVYVHYSTLYNPNTQHTPRPPPFFISVKPLYPTPKTQHNRPQPKTNPSLSKCRRPALLLVI